VVKWKENMKNGAVLEYEERCISEEHKDEIVQLLTERNIAPTIEAIDQTGNEWFEGLKFNSYDEALAAFNKGQQEYQLEQEIKELTDNLKLRADIDYLAVMM